MKTLLLSICGILFISSVSYAGEIQLQSGETQTFSANTTTTVSCNGNRKNVNEPRVVSTFCSCQYINSSYQLILVTVHSNNTRNNLNISDNPYSGYGYSEAKCEEALKKNRSCIGR